MDFNYFNFLKFAIHVESGKFLSHHQFSNDQLGLLLCPKYMYSLWLKIITVETNTTDYQFLTIISSCSHNSISCNLTQLVFLFSKRLLSLNFWAIHVYQLKHGRIHVYVELCGVCEAGLAPWVYPYTCGIVDDVVCCERSYSMHVVASLHCCLSVVAYLQGLFVQHIPCATITCILL